MKKQDVLKKLMLFPCKTDPYYEGYEQDATDQYQPFEKTPSPGINAFFDWITDYCPYT